MLKRIHMFNTHIDHDTLAIPFSIMATFHYGENSPPIDFFKRNGALGAIKQIDVLNPPTRRRNNVRERHHTFTLVEKWIPEEGVHQELSFFCIPQVTDELVGSTFKKLPIFLPRAKKPKASSDVSKNRNKMNFGIISATSNRELEDDKLQVAGSDAIVNIIKFFLIFCIMT